MSDKPKTALITGSGQNIGRAIALHLAEQGFNIVINGSSQQAPCEEVAERARALGAQALVVMANVGVPDDVSRLAQTAIDTFGVRTSSSTMLRYALAHHFSKSATRSGSGSST